MSTNLNKGQTVSLKKADNITPLTSIQLDFGWEGPPPAKPRGLRAFFGGRNKGNTVSGGRIYLDTSAILLDRAGHSGEIICYNRRSSSDGSIVHAGDNPADAGNGEQILVDLSAIPSHVATVLLTITSYDGHAFDSIRNPLVRVLDASVSSPGTEVVKYDMSNESGPNTALIVASLRRQPDDGWTFTAIGDLTSAKTPYRLDHSPYAG